MKTTNLLESITRMKQHGDAVRIASVVNAKRAERQEKPYSPEAIRKMLNGTRTLNSEVADVATKYYEAQEQLNKELAV